MATSTGSGGSARNFAAHVMENTFVASSVELQGSGGLEEHPRDRDHGGRSQGLGHQGQNLDSCLKLTWTSSIGT